MEQLAMPIVDNDIIEVLRTSRSGSENITIDFQLRDGNTNEVKYSGGVTFANADEAMAEVQTRMSLADTAVLALLAAIIHPATGQFRPAVFDNLGGKSFRVTQKIQQV